MKLAKIREWLEIVGLFSVVLSLVFVGLQMKQSQRIAVADQYQARLDSFMHGTEIRLNDRFFLAHVGSLFRNRYIQTAESMPAGIEWKKTIEKLSDEELGRIDFQAMIVFKSLDNLHFQYVNGFVDEGMMKSSATSILATLDLPELGFGIVYQTNASQFPKRFHEFVSKYRRTQLL